MIDYKNKLNKILCYFIFILLCLRLTKLYNYDIFSFLLPISVCLSFILIILNYKMFNKNWVKNNFLLIIYFTIRIISIFINTNSLLNFKALIFEAFFLIIVRHLFNKEKETLTKISKIIVVINFILNIASLISQYIFEMNFNTELYGVYTNPNGMANFTIISLIIYKELLEKKGNRNIKIFNYMYTLFSIIMILLSGSRTPLLCLIIYAIMKILLSKKININIKTLKRIFNVCLLGIIIVIITITYFNKNNTYPTTFELKINNITTNRYYLWKHSIISLEENPIFGVGGNNIGEYRRKCVNRGYIESLITTASVNRLALNNNHNGYFQLLAGNGYICFIIFMIIILKSINKMDKNIFLISSSILIINLFESQLILSQSIQILLLMYLSNYKQEEKE